MSLVILIAFFNKNYEQISGLILAIHKSNYSILRIPPTTTYNLHLISYNYPCIYFDTTSFSIVLANVCYCGCVSFSLFYLRFSLSVMVVRRLSNSLGLAVTWLVSDYYEM